MKGWSAVADFLHESFTLANSDVVRNSGERVEMNKVAQAVEVKLMTLNVEHRPSGLSTRRT
jgi:hypothetical protein